MRLVACVCLAVAAVAAPAWPELSVQGSSLDALDSLSGYFNLVANKVQSAKGLHGAPVCDLSKAIMPSMPGVLPPPGDGLKVRHVAVGRGTQNYTCVSGNVQNSPKAAGALATLFNASCAAALYPDLLDRIPGMAVHFNLNDVKSEHKLGPTQLSVSGIHYFREKTPFFDLDTAGLDAGQAPCAKNSSAPAPSGAAVGQQGEAAVSWLKLTTVEGATGDIKEVFRVSTAGGSPPATCAGMPSKFEVQYAAVYWFYESSSAE